jgi:transglutaminase-like putative cysteine protease
MKRGCRAGLALSLVASSGFARAQEATVGPPPPWVETMELPPEQPPPADVRAGAHYLVVDRQIRVEGGTQQRYYRRAWKVLSTAGVQEASEIKVAFDPAYQRLTFHEVRLWRNGRNVRRFSRADIHLVHEEADLDERLYNGSLSAIVFLKDVRPGDIVDYSYSVAGANPIFNGRFAATFELAYGFPVARLRHRLLWPSVRALNLKRHRTDLTPRVFDSAPTRIYEWERSDVAAVRSEEETPGWFNPQPAVEASEFSSWNEVARWASGLFARDSRPSPRLSALVREIEKAPPPERARRAVRFVQDEVRYLGIEMGSSSHQPHPPEQVLEQRYGDCKDKALLLVRLLRALGVEATPALVSTSQGRALDEEPPSPLAFDHVIVRARIAGTPAWIDATRSETGGAPEATEAPTFERALLVREDATGLTAIPSPERPEPNLVVDETYTVAANAGSTRLLVVTTYRGRSADEKRHFLARVAPADLAKSYLNHYAREDPSVRALAPPAVRDDREANVLVEEERYELPGLWSRGRHDFYAWAVGDELSRPATAVRSMPLRVGHPVHVEHKLTIELPYPLDLEARRQTVGSPAFSLTSRADVQGRRLALDYRYRSLGDFVAAADSQRHLEAVDQAERALGYRVDLSWRLPAPAHGNDDAGSAWVGLGLLAVTAVGLGSFGYRAARQQWRKRAFRARSRLASGESPAAPLRSAPDGRALHAHLAARACPCGARGRLSEKERQTFIYEAKPMDVVTFGCGACGREQALYVLFG